MISIREFKDLMEIAEKEAQGATLFIGGIEVDHTSRDSPNVILYREKQELTNQGMCCYLSSFEKFGSISLKRKRFEKSS